MRKRLAVLIVAASASMAVVRADAPVETRVVTLEKKLDELQRKYEARIAALEAEVAGLKTAAARATGPPAAPGVPAPGAPGTGTAPTEVAQSPPVAGQGAPTQPTAPSDLEAQLARELGAAPAPPGATSPAPPPAAPWSPAQPITLAGGGKNYLNLSFDTLVAGGSSSSRDISAIETGGHDPAQRGFTVQNIETVLEGAVDPYFRGQGNIVFQIDPKGETTVELEEAYLTSTSLPHNLQVKAGMYFSEFGRLNAQHPHSWDFVDQPLVNGRFLGPDGLRNPGARLSWLMPLHFYSELFLSVQNSQGETAASFRNVPGDTVFGRTVQERELRTAGDLLYVPRWSGSFDVSANSTLVAGASAAFGPNGTGSDTSTRIYGADVFWKWKAANAQAGFPFVKWQTEAMWRRYETDASLVDTNGDGTGDLSVPRETLKDSGAYSQILWGFRLGWVAGLRVDHVGGDSADFEGDLAGPRRWRVSPNLTWFPTEYSKFRLQWNHDRLQESDSENSLWLQFEFLLGAHAAHKF